MTTGEKTARDVTPEEAIEALSSWSSTECNRCHNECEQDGGRWAHTSARADCFGAIEGDVTTRRSVHSMAVGGAFAFGADNDYDGAVEEIRNGTQWRLRTPSRPGDHNLAVRLADGRARLYGTKALP